MIITKPSGNEFPEYLGYYIGLVAENDALAALQNGADNVIRKLAAVPGEKWDYRYAPGKWNAKEVLVHLADTERIFGFRALSFARGEKGSLPGFEQDDYAAFSGAGSRSAASILEEYLSVRKATISLFGSFSPEALLNMGVANNLHVSVRALGFAIAGHELHHLAVLSERYGI